MTEPKVGNETEMRPMDRCVVHREGPLMRIMVEAPQERKEVVMAYLQALGWKAVVMEDGILADRPCKTEGCPHDCG